LHDETFEIDNLEFCDINDPEEYWERVDKGMIEAGKILGVASRCCKHDSKPRQLLSLVGWMPFYYLFN
jgi:hypothetical protein